MRPAPQTGGTSQTSPLTGVSTLVRLPSCLRDLSVDLGGLQMKIRGERYGPHASHFTDHQISELHELNFENNCHYYGPELKKLLKGTPLKPSLSKAECRFLRKRGLIIRQNNRILGTHYTVSPKALEILKTV